MVVDSMRYWVQEMGVDGFRFDLATELIRDGEHHVDQNHDFKKLIAQDPAFKGVKMIAEPWDLKFLWLSGRELGTGVERVE